MTPLALALGGVVPLVIALALAGIFLDLFMRFGSPWGSLRRSGGESD